MDCGSALGAFRNSTQDTGSWGEASRKEGRGAPTNKNILQRDEVDSTRVRHGAIDTRGTGVPSGDVTAA